MTQRSKTRKIIWAVDPFEKKLSVLRSAAWAIRALTQKGSFEIQPVYVWAGAPSETRSSPNSKFCDNLQKVGQHELEKALAQIKAVNIRPLELLCKRYFTLRQGVRQLVELAKERDAEMIVLSTHCHRGLKRLFLGSFAEAITLLSDIPLLIVQPHWKRVPEFKQILFPTDFSDESKEAFLRVIEFAKEKRSKIVLFHRAISTPYPIFEPTFAMYPSYIEAFTEDPKEVKAEASAWAELAKTQGVRTTIKIDLSRSGSAADSILKASEKLNCMIALASQSGWASTLLLGSTTRQVVRRSKQPVWVIHPSRSESDKSHGLVRPLYVVTQEDMPKRSVT